MDVLADALSTAGVRGVLGARIEAGGDWGWWSAPSAGAAFHAVASGVAWVALPDGAPRQLMAGDLLLLPRGTAHALGSDESAVLRARGGRSDPYERAERGVVRIGGGATRTHILCAHYEHDPAVSTHPLRLLPEVLHVRADSRGGHLDDTVRLLARELADRQLATDLVLDRLVDILLVQVVRAWLVQQRDVALPSWLGALRDPVVGQALTAIHRAPDREWTTATLAREVAVSRATLARRFPAVVGETPGAYLTRWRMDLAARRLRDTDDSVEEVAHSVGYGSVHAFSRAFRRTRSVAPGRYRAAARADAVGAGRAA